MPNDLIISKDLTIDIFLNDSLDEIIKELKLAIQECGRKLGIHVRKQKRIKDELIKRSYIEIYLPHIGQALKEILVLKEPQVNKVVNNLTTILEKTRSLP